MCAISLGSLSSIKHCFFHIQVQAKLAWTQMKRSTVLYLEEDFLSVNINVGLHPCPSFTF